MLGLHVESLGGDWRTAPLLGVQGGYDLIGRLGIALRYENAVRSELAYVAFSIGLAYRH